MATPECQYLETQLPRNKAIYKPRYLETQQKYLEQMAFLHIVSRSNVPHKCVLGSKLSQVPWYIQKSRIQITTTTTTTTTTVSRWIVYKCEQSKAGTLRYLEIQNLDHFYYYYCVKIDCVQVCGQSKARAHSYLISSLSPPHFPRTPHFTQFLHLFLLCRIIFVLQKMPQNYASFLIYYINHTFFNCFTP